MASADVSPRASCSRGLGSVGNDATFAGYSQYLVVNSSTINNVSYSLATTSQGQYSNNTNNNFQAYLLDGGGNKGWYESKSGHTLDDIWGPTLGTGVQTQRGGTKLTVAAWFLGTFDCKGTSWAF
ncbi:hypothetical protein [Kitasatospora indigofera]|uniref:Uncharacterized protein n=1 Tax=Kitasatospora indigofera TaxID=67307 RepID=A0A919FCN8_9ACTN|nr:hypothetical protein [Kitasatospora indigofera]GHH61138.1 hypothetical protein GCM10018781_07050 [Kitasatospora indigofera]